MKFNICIDYINKRPIDRIKMWKISVTVDDSIDYWEELTMLYSYPQNNNRVEKLRRLFFFTQNIKK